jgi:hypothetical protein
LTVIQIQIDEVAGEAGLPGNEYLFELNRTQTRGELDPARYDVQCMESQEGIGEDPREVIEIALCSVKSELFQ